MVRHTLDGEEKAGKYYLNYKHRTVSHVWLVSGNAQNLLLDTTIETYKTTCTLQRWLSLSRIWQTWSLYVYHFTFVELLHDESHLRGRRPPRSGLHTHGSWVRAPVRPTGTALQISELSHPQYLFCKTHSCTIRQPYHNHVW